MKVVIFCGGFGTRIWPISRKSFPKQFFPLIKGKSFFELTYARFLKVFNAKDIIISTEKAYIPIVRRLHPGIPRENIIAEPERKDNLAAIGLVAAILEKKFPGEVMIVSWSDHIITHESVFLRAILAAAQVARDSDLVVSVNEEPKTPSTHNEWVKVGHLISEINSFSVLEIVKLIKRPNENMAKKLFQSSGYLINTGYRAFRTDVMMQYYHQFQPQIFAGLVKITESLGKRDFDSILYREYHQFKKESIEFGIFAKLGQGKQASITVDFGWKDAGTWELFYKALRVKDEENVVEGEAIFETLESQANLVIGPKGKLISLIGVKDLIIIDTQDALLVSSMNSSAKVKDLFSTLERKRPNFVK